MLTLQIKQIINAWSLLCTHWNPDFSPMVLHWENLAADAGYSSGENLAFLERKGIDSYIPPPHGTYKGGREGFTYHQKGDYWACPEGKKVTFRGIRYNKGNKRKHYYTRRSDCKVCPIKTACIGKDHEKKIGITYYREEYERAIVRSKSRLGKRMKSLRQSTVEPVFGTLIEHLGMRKMNTLGIRQAISQLKQSLQGFFAPMDSPNRSTLTMEVRSDLSQPSNDLPGSPTGSLTWE